MSLSDPLHDYRICDTDDFLQKFRYIICHNVQVEKAFPWLRHRKVLELFDEEKIENEHNTSCQRAGHMVDLVMRRGKNGFNALLEHIEYDYPELFEKFTGQKARPPCKGYRQDTSKRRSTMDSLSDFWNISQKVMSSVLKERSNRHVMELSMDKLKTEMQESEWQLATMRQQNRELSLKYLEIQEQLKDMREQRDDNKKEKHSILQQCEYLRGEVDDYRARYMNLKEDTERMSLRRVSLRNPGRTALEQTVDTLRQDCELLRDECAQLRQKLQEDQSNNGTANREAGANEVIKSQSREIERLKNDKQNAAEEKAQLLARFESLEVVCDEYKCSNNDYKTDVKKIKDERDGIMAQLVETKARNEHLLETNAAYKLKVDHLIGELRQMRYETDTYLCPVSHRTYSNIENVYSEVADRTDGALEDGEHDETTTYGKSHYAEIEAPPEKIDSASSSDEDVLETELATRKAPPVYSRSTSQPVDLCQESKPELRPTSVNRPNSLTASFTKSKISRMKHPLVLYAPTVIYRELTRQLLAQSQLFTHCPTEETADIDMLKDLMERGSYVHYEQKADKLYECIATKTLRSHMKQGRARVLLEVTPQAIDRLVRQHINPIVFLVKYSDVELRGEESEEEQKLRKVFYTGQYDKVLVARNEEPSSIVHKITRMCMASGRDNRGGAEMTAKID